MKEFQKYHGILYMVTLFVAVPLIIWNLSIKDTIKSRVRLKELNNEFQHLQARQNANSNTQLYISSDDIIGGGRLLSSLQSYSQMEGVTLERYTPYVTSREDHARISTAEIVFRGKYISIIKIFKHIEDDIPQCKFLSANFKTSIDRSNKEKYLHTTILIQQIIQNK